MNSPKVGIEQLLGIAKQANRDLPLSERCALFAACRFLLDDLRAEATSETDEIDGYLSEKLEKARWHISAALGFDIDNGHDDEQHRVWAYGALGTLRDLFSERFADDD